MLCYHFLINRQHPMQNQVIPGDLMEPAIPFAPDSVGEKRLLRRKAALALEDLFQGARRDEIYLAGVSGFRSYERQKEIYEESMRTKGAEHTHRYIAKPGTSEHHSGLAMDVSCEEVEYDLVDEFEQTREGIWLRKNAFLYGYIIRYPRGKEKITGYACEPWHIRYVTPSLAYFLYKMNLTLEEYHARSFISRL